MGIFAKNLRTHRWVAGLLLLVYGSAGVLGYGLHAVWECEHHGHEHVHAGCAAHSHHAHGCHHHHHEPVVPLPESDHDGTVNLTLDDCPICAFLVQAQTPVVLGNVADCGEPASATVALRDTSYTAPLLGLHLARGPPLG